MLDPGGQVAANSRHVSGVKGDHHPSWPASARWAEHDAITKVDSNNTGMSGCLQQAGLSLDVIKCEWHLLPRGIKDPGGVQAVQQAGAHFPINHIDKKRAGGNPGGVGDVEVGPQPLAAARGAAVPGAVGRIQVPGNGQALVKGWGGMLIGREGPGREQQ